MAKRMLVHIYIYEYIFPLHPLWLHLKIEKNYHSKGEKREGENIMLFMRKTSVDSEKERVKKKKVSAHFKSNTLGYCFCNRKQDFFFMSPPSPPTSSLFFSSCIYNTYRTRLLNCEDRVGSSLWCKRSWNATPRRGSWVWGIKRKWEGGIKKSSSDLWCSSNKFTLWQKIHGCNKRVIPALTHAIRWFWPGC